MSFYRLEEELVSDESREEILNRRIAIDTLRLRADHLKGAERALIKMYLDGCSYRQIADLLGINETSVLRRVRRITQRLLDDKYRFLMGFCENLSSFELAVGKDYFICGISQQGISERRLCSLYSVKKAIERVKRYSQRKTEGLSEARRGMITRRSYAKEYQGEKEFCMG